MEDPMRKSPQMLEMEMEDKEEDEDMDRLIIIETEDDGGDKKKAISADDVISVVKSDKGNNKYENSDDQTFKEDKSEQESKLEKWDLNKEKCLTLGNIGESVASNIERPVSSIQMEKWLKSYPTNMTTLLKSDSLPPSRNQKNLLEKTVTQDVNLDIACPDRLPSNLRNFRKNSLGKKVIEEEPVVLQNDVNLDIACPDTLSSNHMLLPKVEKPEDNVFMKPPTPSQPFNKTDVFSNVYQTNSSSIQTPEGIKKIEKWMNNKTKIYSKEVDEEKLYFVAVPRDFEVKLDKQVAEKNIEFLASKQSPAIKITDQSQIDKRLEYFHFNQPITSPNPLSIPIPTPTISNPDIIQKNKIRSSNHVLLTPKTPQQILDNQAAVAGYQQPVMVTSKNTPNRFTNGHLQPSPDPVIVTTSHSFIPNLQLAPKPVTSLYNLYKPQIQHALYQNGYNPQLQPPLEPVTIKTPKNYIMNLQPTPEPEPLKVTTCISYNQNLQTTPQPGPLKVPTNNFNFQLTPEPITVPMDNSTSNKSDSIQTEPEKLVARKFTQHQMDYCGTPILLLNFYSKFTLLIPEKEEFVEENEATVEVKTQHLGDKKKLTFIRFLFDRTNSEITAPVLHADHLDTGMELIRNQTPCVFLGQPFQNVENVQEPTESNSLKTNPNESSNFNANCSALNKINMSNPSNSKRSYTESFSPNKLLISPSSSVNSSSPIDAYQAVNADQPQIPISLNPISPSLRAFRKEPIPKKFEESEISTPKSIRRIESWMNKSSNAMAASSRVIPATEHKERISTLNPAIKTLLLTPSPILKMLTAAPAKELSPLELPTIIPHQSSVSPNERQLKHQTSESMIDVQFKLPIITHAHPRLPISGDVIMGLQGGQSLAKISEKTSTYVGSDFQSKASPVAKQPSLKLKVPVVNVGSSPIIEMNVLCSDISDDEPPQKICRFEPKPSCSYQHTDQPIPDLIPVIHPSYSSPSPPSLESPIDDSSNVQNDPQTLGLFAELERRLNEPLPVPVEENPGVYKDELTVISASDGEDMEEEEEEEEEDDEEYVEGDNSEDYVPVGDERGKSKAIKKDKPSNTVAVPRPGSTRGRLKNCDKISRWLVTLLRDPDINPSVITWIRPEDGIFKIVNSSKLAVLWGKKKGNPNMDYSKLSRAMRYYYKTGELEVVNSRLTYRFGDRMTNWKPINPEDPNFINTRTASPSY